jgi:hypothetical protein
LAKQTDWGQGAKLPVKTFFAFFAFAVKFIMSVRGGLNALFAK